jgi:hypothetical protein
LLKRPEAVGGWALVEVDLGVGSRGARRAHIESVLMNGEIRTIIKITRWLRRIENLVKRPLSGCARLWLGVILWGVWVLNKDSTNVSEASKWVARGGNRDGIAFQSNIVVRS